MKSVPAPRFLSTVCVLCLLAIAASAHAQSEPTQKALHGPPKDTLTDVAFEHFYNMDYDRATQEFEKLVEKHPDDPFAVNHLLTVVLMHDLYDTGAMNTGDYSAP